MLFRRVPRDPSASQSNPTQAPWMGKGEPPLTPQATNQRPAFLPTAVRRELTLMLWRSLAGLVLLAAPLLALALASYNPMDPSANNSTHLPASNWLGRPGAYAADLLRQGLGAVAWLLIALLGILGAWVWRQPVLHQPFRRIFWGAITLLLTSLCLALFLPGLRLPGGVLGFVLVSFFPGIWPKILVTPLAVLGLACALAHTLAAKPLRTLLARPRPTKPAQNPPQDVGTEAPRLRFAWSWPLLKRPQQAPEDPAAARPIPSFLRSGPVDQHPEATAPHSPLGQTNDEPPLEPQAGRSPPDGLERGSDRELDRGFDGGFIPLGDSEEEEFELRPITSSSLKDQPEADATPACEPPGSPKPSAKLVETVQLARQKTGASSPRHIASVAAATAGYTPPPLSLLYAPSAADRSAAMTQEEADATAARLEATLQDYGVKGEITRVLPGPVVTLYELEPAPGTKTSRVVGLADDIARSMAALSARIAPVPGRSVIGIELPNPKRETVFLHEMLQDPRFLGSKATLPLALGKDIGGQAVMSDLAKMPHLLVAGTTGSGKSVAVNTMILSLVYALSPERVRFIMIDPKILELSVYDGIPHLLSPVVTDPKKAVVALKWVVQEMNQRYQSMSTLNVRNIANYNSKIKTALAEGDLLSRQVQVGFDPDTGEAVYEEQAFDMRPLPHIVVIVDEMAELMLMVGKDIEAAIQSIAQKARAAGIHMIMATQRPSVDVITGTIKANFPSRISFAVSSKIDSRTVLNEMGAEQLLGQGDMLYQPNGSRTQRVHGPFASDDEVEAVVDHLRTLGSPDYVAAIEDEEALEDAAGPAGLDAPLFEKESSGNDLYDRAVRTVLQDRKASTSHVQRRLQIGYNRAANLIDRMEQEGLITPADHVGRRKIIAPDDSP